METLLGWDRAITEFLYYQDAGLGLQRLIFSAASLFIYVIPAVLLVMFWRSQRDRIVALKILVAVGLAWKVLSNLTGQLLYDGFGFRDRPFAAGGFPELFFERPEKAFPSDHAAVIAVMVLGLFVYRYPKMGWVFLVLGGISSLSRVIIGFHWFGDVIGGWLIGALAVGVIWLFDRPLTNFFEWLIRKLSRSYGKR
ncbi:MAG: phosphatase PAP2 family protein [Patescibacteria group bacterium]